jgi:predicted Zn-ribbon and HTH transcriptional regulator
MISIPSKCPKCKGNDIRHSESATREGWYCNNCGYNESKSKK